MMEGADLVAVVAGDAVKNLSGYASSILYYPIRSFCISDPTTRSEEFLKRADQTWVNAIGSYSDRIMINPFAYSTIP